MNNSPLITLITDWGYKDFYCGKFLGKLYSAIPNARIVEITHGIDKFKTEDAAFVARNSCFDFPPETIHIIDVASNMSNVIVKSADQYFICSDNNVSALIFSDKKAEFYSLNALNNNYTSFTFVAASIFIDVIKKIADKVPLNVIGTQIDSLKNKQHYSQTPVFGNPIECIILYFDDYGNAILNLTKEEFDKITQNKDFSISISPTDKITSVSPTYNKDIVKRDDVSKPLLSVSSSGYMALSLPNASYKELIFGNNLIPSMIEYTIRIKLTDKSKT
ncbi:MAG: SAM-dependent chlorinase/fluorinase [Bacteroidales bacterium]|jgi:S-adenosylmethionine hydrolase|nr:SAM-dependent chlorinase/fluorinase [Bacteroidales bacterium]